MTSPQTADSTPRPISPSFVAHPNLFTSDSESTTDRDVPADEDRGATNAATSPSDPSRSAGPNASSSPSSSLLVERALRSRVAYSERPSKVLPPSAHREDTIRMANVALCNERIYCTIDCMKGLKVQMLSIICIFRIGNKIYASGYTPFPPPSSLKRKERTRVSRPKRSSPYRKSDLDEEEGEEDMEDFDSEAYDSAIQLASGPHTHHSSSYMHSSSLASSYASQSLHHSHAMMTGIDPLAHGRVAIPFGPMAGSIQTSILPSSSNGILEGSATGPLHLRSPDIVMAPNPYATTIAARATAGGSSTAATSAYIQPQFIPGAAIASAGLPTVTPNGQEALSSREKSIAVTSAGLPDGPSGARPSAWTLVNSRMKAMATAYAERTLTAISRVAHLHSFLNNVTLATGLEDIAQWCLAGGVPLETKLVARVLDALSLPCFVGPLDHTPACELLSASLLPHLPGIFLIRTVKDDPLALEIYGLYRAGGLPNSTASAPAVSGAIQEYYATIRIQFGAEPGMPATFWIDTEANAEESRCASLSSLVTYISRVTGWSSIDRDCIQDPQLNISASAASASSAPTQRVQSWATLLDPNVLSQQYGLAAPDSANFTSPYDMFNAPSVSCYHPSGAGSSGLSFPHYGNGTRWTTD